MTIGTGGDNSDKLLTGGCQTLGLSEQTEQSHGAGCGKVPPRDRDLKSASGPLRLISGVLLGSGQATGGHMWLSCWRMHKMPLGDLFVGVSNAAEERLIQVSPNELEAQRQSLAG